MRKRTIENFTNKRRINICLYTTINLNFNKQNTINISLQTSLINLLIHNN